MCVQKEYRLFPGRPGERNGGRNSCAQHLSDKPSLEVLLQVFVAAVGIRRAGQHPLRVRGRIDGQHRVGQVLAEQLQDGLRGCKCRKRVDVLTRSTKCSAPQQVGRALHSQGAGIFRKGHVQGFWQCYIWGFGHFFGRSGDELH